jgi:hypothetical protein
MSVHHFTVVMTVEGKLTKKEALHWILARLNGGDAAFDVVEAYPTKKPKD